MIRVNDISLVMNKRQILSHISLELQNGNIYGLAGNNGCGKTMLMKCICGFVHPTEGQVEVDGKIIGKDLDYLLDAGIIIETPGFIGYYSGLQNLKVLAGIRHKIGQEKIRNTMCTVGLDPDLKLPVKKYSLGMRQRLGLAQAIMEDPPILLLDEPMNGLDEAGIQFVRELLQRLRNHGKLILMASHMKEDLDLLCDEIYRVHEGSLFLQC